MLDLTFLSYAQWFTLGLSSFLLLIFLGHAFKIRRSFSWLPAEGTVMASRIEQTKDREGTKMYYPRIEYCYQVDGVRRTGTNRFFSQSSISIRDLVTDPGQKYPEGSSVEVIYNPQRPDESALLSERPTGFWHYFALLIPLTGYGLLLFGIVK